MMAPSEFRASNPDGNNTEPYKLDHLFLNDIVRYKCSCGQFRRLHATYFCRHCMTLRCRSCVAHEVDSQYCQHCLEYIPTIDPKFQMNKCASCYQCPSCQHLLSTSILSVSTSTTDLSNRQGQTADEVVTRTCKLVCEFCRWSSGTFMKEGSKVSSDLGDSEVQNESRISELMAFYRAVSQKEKSDKKKRRFHSRSGNTMDLLKKYGIDNTLSPKLFESLRARTTFHDKSSALAKYNLEPKSNDDSAIETFAPAEAVDVDELGELDMGFYYDKNFEADKISGIRQRLSQIEFQPDKVADFRPISKSLSVKRSLRCKKCERNLCRSEYSPLSIRFKIQSAAFYYIPDLKLRVENYPIKLKLGEDNIVEFTLQNQTLTLIKAKLDKLDEANNDLYDVALPPYELSLGSKDDTVDYEYIPLDMRPLNETTQVVFQSLSKVGFYIKVKPKKKVEALAIQFRLTHDVLLLQNPQETDKTERVSHIVEVLIGSVD